MAKASKGKANNTTTARKRLNAAAASNGTKKKGGIKEYFKGVKLEMKKVVWPTGKQVVNNTVWVLVLVAVISAVVLAFDLLLEKGDHALWQMISKWIG